MKKLPLVFIIVLLAACGSPDPADAPDAVEAYLSAVAEQETEAAINRACADYESDARREVDSFAGVETELDGVTCSLATPDAAGSEVIVTCEGAIVATYNDEDQRLELDERQYITRYEAGAWRVCGYND